MKYNITTWPDLGAMSAGVKSHHYGACFGDYDLGAAVGSGETEEAALVDLVTNYDLEPTPEKSAEEIIAGIQKRKAKEAAQAELVAATDAATWLLLRESGSMNESEHRYLRRVVDAVRAVKALP